MCAYLYTIDPHISQANRGKPPDPQRLWHCPSVKGDMKFEKDGKSFPLAFWDASKNENSLLWMLHYSSHVILLLGTERKLKILWGLKQRIPKPVFRFFKTQIFLKCW